MSSIGKTPVEGNANDTKLPEGAGFAASGADQANVAAPVELEALHETMSEPAVWEHVNLSLIHI